MAGNRHDNGQGGDPRQGWAASGQQPYGGNQPYGPPSGEPEYFTAPHPQASHPQPPQGGDRYAGDQPGHTRAFAVGEEPYGPYDPYPPQQPYGGEPYAEGAYGDDPYGGYDQGGYGAEDNVAVYRAGGQSAPQVSGPPLPWRALLVGIYREPARTFARMRDHQVWLPALAVSLIYGVLAVFALGSTRQDVVNSTFSVAAWSIVAAAIGFTVAGGMLGAVTFGLARQFGGDGPWQSTVGLAVLIGWTTDAPRLLLALFLPTGNMVVQVVGWITWLICAVLLTTMVRRIHDLPWGKAAGAAALQLLALLVLIKLPTLG
ncbi:Yip1 family protein [Kitasatospora camelliae]|uniref:Yip1 family protein n=1 Tax=Kitasatospora camelliae TaxID=3156397 RepID=A0AAU8JZW6_9ACTN